MIQIIKETITICTFVFAMLLLVDFLEVVTKGKIKYLVKGRPLLQYPVASALGTLPGCFGLFVNVSFYMRGLLTFGALTAGMIASTGDEAFVMLELFPGKALILFGILIALGIVMGPLVDYFAAKFKIFPSDECETKHIHNHSCEGFYRLKNLKIITPSRAVFIIISAVLIILTYFNLLETESFNSKIFMLVILALLFIMALTVSEHYLKDHIIDHIIKKHMWRIFLWTVFALIFVKFGLKFLNLEELVKSNMAFVLILSALVGLIPESGPNLIFVFLFAKGFIPFSVLFTNSFIQDGHGCLPLLAYSVRDAVYIKLFKLVVGLILGIILFKMGI